MSLKHAGTACSLVDTDMDERGTLFRLDGNSVKAVTEQIDSYLQKVNKITSPLAEAEVRRTYCKCWFLSPPKPRFCLSSSQFSVVVFLI